MKHSLMILFFVVIFFLPGVVSPSADSRETKRVLVLYSLEKGNVGQERIDAQLQRIFSGNKTFTIRIYNEYLDLIRFPEAKQISHLTDFLHQKYAREKPDVILTILPPALDCLEQYGKRLFEGIPVVAACLPRDRVESLAGSPLRKRATGIIYVDNAYEIAQSALRLRPGTKHIALVAGASPLDISFKVPILREIKRAAGGGMELIDLSGLTIGETLSRVHNLPPDTIVFNTSIFRDKEGVTFHPPEALRMVSHASNAPVFGFVETHMGKGIVGGRVASLQWQIEKVAELVQRVLAGESSAAIPIAEEAGYLTIYDWKELKRWGIQERMLPKGSILINQELNVFERYKLYIIAALVFITVQTVLIGFLIHLNRVQRKTATSNGFVQVSMRDNGPGIPAEQVDSVFDPFYTAKNNGLGMGLAVCKSIITTHEGRIWAENNPEGGATLSFALRAADHD